MPSIRRLPYLFDKDLIQQLLLAIKNHKHGRIYVLHRNLLITMLFYSLGLRPCELLQLTIYDIDYKKAEMRVRPEITKKTRGIIKERCLPLPKPLLDLIRYYIIRYAPKLKKTEERYLFPAQSIKNKSSKHLTARTLRKAFEKYIKEAGLYDPYLKEKNTGRLRNKYHIYAFRHTFGTEIYELTQDILKVKSLMGHSDIRSTELYIDLSQKVKRKAIEKIFEKIINIQNQKNLFASSFVYPSW